MRTTWSARAAVAAAFGLLVAGCGDGTAATAPSGATSSAEPATSASEAAYSPDIDPAAFGTTIDNPYLPFEPGTRMTYEGTTADGFERIVVEVTKDTKTVMGVECVVVRDTVTLDGEVIEDTYDWYAQHDDGTVWYFGEDTRELENGEVLNTKGSWEAGVDGAQPGIVMQAEPKVGETYRQEFYEGEAEDMADVLSITEKTTVEFGTFEDVLKTFDYTPLDPEALEHKYYAPGVGFVLEEKTEGPPESIELVKVEQV